MINLDTLNGDRTDQELWEEIRGGDELAFTVLFGKYHATLFNYGSKLTSNSAIVEDAVQDVFIDIWRLRQNLTDNVASVKFYLYRALRRRIHLAHGKFPLTEQLAFLDDQNTPASFSDSESILIAHESSTIRAKRVQELLSQLPERQVEALTLRYFDEFSTAEIALIMGVSEKSVRNFMYKALTSLRQNRLVLNIPTLIFWLLLIF